MHKFKLLHLLLVGLLAFGFSAPVFAQDDEDEKTEKLMAVDMQPLVVVLTKNFKTQGVLMLAYRLFVADTGASEKVARRKPQIAAALHQTLTRLSKLRIPVNKPVNITLVDLFMQRTVDDLLGKDVAEVVIYSAAIQKQ